ncbi:MAG: DUF1569 domain-containing protein [Pirellulales bacterium]|nr:DUF1569 domain-containing protein [Pirellulales bacterium]
MDGDAAAASRSRRRALKFATLDEAVRDAEHLLACGYDRAGNWDLNQCCRHLAAVMLYPLDGFPAFAFPLNVMAWLLSKTWAPRFLRQVLERGEWPAGGATDKRTVQPSGGNDRDGVAQLKAAVARLEGHEGPLHPSPLFGPLDKATLVRLHCIHTAHHLSFLVPRS